jgi:hypothetical protein
MADAKVVETKGEVQTIELCKYKPDKDVLVLGSTTTKAQIVVEVKRKLTKLEIQRLWDLAGQSTVDEYRKIIEEEVQKLEKVIKGKLAAAQKEPGKINLQREAQQAINDTLTSVNGAVRALQNAVNVAVQKQLAQDARNDQLLLDARVRTVIKALTITAQIGFAIARLVGSHGGDATAYISLITGVIAAYKLVVELLKTVEDRKRELQKAVDEYNKAAGDAKKRADALKKVQKAHLAHRNELTSMKNKMIKLAKQAELIDDSIKKNASPEQTKKLLADAKTIETKAQNLYTALIGEEKWAKDFTAKLDAEAKAKTANPKTLIDQMKAIKTEDVRKAIVDGPKHLKDFTDKLKTVGVSLGSAGKKADELLNLASTVASHM